MAASVTVFSACQSPCSFPPAQGGTAEQRALVDASLDQFTRWVPDEGTCVQSVQIDDEVRVRGLSLGGRTGGWPQPNIHFAGWRLDESNEIPASVVLHEAVHVVDRNLRIAAHHMEDLYAPPSVVDVLGERQAIREQLADIGEYGPARLDAVRARWEDCGVGAGLAADASLLLGEVYVDWVSAPRRWQVWTWRHHRLSGAFEGSVFPAATGGGSVLLGVRRWVAGEYAPITVAEIDVVSGYVDETRAGEPLDDPLGPERNVLQYEPVLFEQTTFSLEQVSWANPADPVVSPLVMAREDDQLAYVVGSCDASGPVVVVGDAVWLFDIDGVDVAWSKLVP